MAFKLLLMMFSVFNLGWVDIIDIIANFLLNCKLLLLNYHMNITLKSQNTSGAVLKKMDKSVRKLSPDLLHALASMGHNDKIVLGDANFAAANYGAKCQGEPRPRLVRADGHKITDLLKGILKLLPLEKDVDM